jgi:hypothetical protein
VRRHRFIGGRALALGLAIGGAVAAAGCGGAHGPLDGTTGFGATNGALTIRGHLRDAAGRAIVGAHVALDGDARAERLSNFTGGFDFHVSPGSYALRASGDCTFVAADVSLTGVVADTTQDFDATSDGCVTSTPSNVVSTGEVLTVNPLGGYTFASIGSYSGAADAMAGLDLITEEIPSTPVHRLTIAGDPALEEQVVIHFSGPTIPAGGGGGDPGGGSLLHVTTAIAAGDQVVRFETELPPDAAADVVDRFVAAGRSFTRDEIADLHGPPPP